MTSALPRGYLRSAHMPDGSSARYWEVLKVITSIHSGYQAQPADEQRGPDPRVWANLSITSEIATRASESEARDAYLPHLGLVFRILQVHQEQERRYSQHGKQNGFESCSGVDKKITQHSCKVAAKLRRKRIP